MKNLFFVYVVLLFAFLSCRNDDLGVQRIDQLINIYIDSAGRDMLNNNINGSYSNIQWNDVYGLTDNSPVTFSNKKDADTIHYLEYIAGAKRVGVDSVGEFRSYESKIALRLTKKLTDSTNSVANDTMIIRYEYTPEVFQVSEIWYNNILKFTKVTDQPNIIKISK